MISEHFVRKEFACPDQCGFDAVDVELLAVLEDIRFAFDKPLIINSACRCAQHNAKIGGSPKSQHLLGKAADIRVEGFTPEKVYNYLLKIYPNKFGLGLYDTWVHVDVREGQSRWNGQKLIGDS